MEILKINCQRCEHEWVPRKSEIKVCPKCKSPYWNIPRITKKIIKVI